MLIFTEVERTARQAFNHGIIGSDEVWMQMIESRDTLCAKIVSCCCTVFGRLKNENLLSRINRVGKVIHEKEGCCCVP
jgi:hypothetical protein